MLIILLIIVNFLWLGLHPVTKIPLIPRYFAEYQALMEVKKFMPLDKKVGVPLMLGAHFGEYRYMGMSYPPIFSDNVKFDYVLFDKFIDYKPSEIDDMESYRQNLLNSGYAVYKDDKYFQLLVHLPMY